VVARVMYRLFAAKSPPMLTPDRQARSHEVKERERKPAAPLNWPTSLLYNTPLLPTRTLSRRAIHPMKAGETVMRSSHSLMPFLAPTAYRQPARRAVFSQCRAQPMQVTASRSFATSMRRRQDNDAFSGIKSSPQRPAKTTTASQDISSILDGALDMKKGTPTTPAGRTSRFASNSAQGTSSPARAQLTADKNSSRTSMDDLMMQFTDRSNIGGKRDVAGSLNPRGNRSGPPPVAQPAPMKLGPTLGRTVYVDTTRGIDVARAFRSMEIQVGRNQVRRDFNRQRFHERGGTKRKRLHSERWRRRFKQGFQAAVKRVLKMRKQGW
jgi:small subunit ribosomal protein MRP21